MGRRRFLNVSHIPQHLVSPISTLRCDRQFNLRSSSPCQTFLLTTYRILETSPPCPHLNPTRCCVRAGRRSSSASSSWQSLGSEVPYSSRLGLEPGVFGLVLTAWTGGGGVVAFSAAALLRIRSLSVFGVRRVSWRWLLIGVGAGIAAFVLKSLAILAWIQITGGDNATVQSMYGEGGSGGVLSLILATLFLSLLTPLGEELLFRGVVTNALLRYGPFIGVVGSALIFAVSHGINNVFPAALVTGLIAGEVFRRSKSVWPAVVVHAVVNLPTVPALVLAGMG